MGGVKSKIGCTKRERREEVEIERSGEKMVGIKRERERDETEIERQQQHRDYKKIVMERVMKLILTTTDKERSKGNGDRKRKKERRGITKQSERKGVERGRNDREKKK